MAFVQNSKLSALASGILPENACVVIVRTFWNAMIVDLLESGCKKILQENGINHISSCSVPGAVEIPFAVKHYWNKHKDRDPRPAAFIVLGCVIRGGTPHFDYVCRVVADGVLQLNLQLPVPTIFGVLTVDDEQQAKERIGGTHGHKGEEAAWSALQMIAFMHGNGV